MEFRILGPLEVTQDGRALELGATKQQTLLAVLLLHAGEIVSPTRLMTELWGEEPPSTAAKGIQGYVSSLRRILGAGRDRHADARVRARRPSTSTPPCSSAWPPRGAPARRWRCGAAAAAGVSCRGASPPRRSGGSGSCGSPRWSGGSRRTSRRAATPSWSASCSAGGAAPAARALPRAADARAVPRGPPGRRAGGLPRRAQLLIDELGLEPGEELRRLQRRDAASSDPALDAPRPAPAAPARGGAARAAASAGAGSSASCVADGQPAADSTPRRCTRCALRDRCARVIERHGGTVERRRGRAVIGFFGLAAAARGRRAARAARGRRAARRRRRRVQLGIDARRGLRRLRRARRAFASGQALSRRRALQARRADGEILLERATLTGSSSRPSRAEPAGDAWRLRGAARAARRRAAAARPARSSAATRELGALRDAFADARRERAAGCVTVVGAAGHRQVAARARARRRGRRRRDRRQSAAACPTARASPTPARGDRRASSADRRGSRAARRRRAGRVQPRARRDRRSEEPGQAEETSGRFRRLLEAAARERPLVVSIEDVHWAEPALLDLARVPRRASRRRADPARLPRAARSCWRRARRGRRRSAALGARARRRSARPTRAELVAGARRRRAGAPRGSSTRAEGNPLFLEQLVAVGAERRRCRRRSRPCWRRASTGSSPASARCSMHASVEGRSFHARRAARAAARGERRHDVRSSSSRSCASS